MLMCQASEIKRKIVHEKHKEEEHELLCSSKSFLFHVNKEKHQGRLNLLEEKPCKYPTASARIQLQNHLNLMELLLQSESKDSIKYLRGWEIYLKMFLPLCNIFMFGEIQASNTFIADVTQCFFFSLRVSENMKL